MFNFHICDFPNLLILDFKYRSKCQRTIYLEKSTITPTSIPDGIINNFSIDFEEIRKSSEKLEDYEQNQLYFQITESAFISMTACK